MDKDISVDKSNINILDGVSIDKQDEKSKLDEQVDIIFRLKDFAGKLKELGEDAMYEARQFRDDADYILSAAENLEQNYIDEALNELENASFNQYDVGHIDISILEDDIEHFEGIGDAIQSVFDIEDGD